MLTYSGGVIDRAAKRGDPEWVGAVLAADGARLISMWRDQCIVSGEPAAPVIQTAAGAEAVLKAAAETVFLGLDDGRRRLSNEPASLWITQKSYPQA